MSDFFQNGNVSTLHNLTRRSVEDLEAELANFSTSRPIGLVLPSLYSELEGPALENIVSELAKVPYLSRITIGLDRADKDQYAHAKEYFSRLPQKHTVLWHDGPRLKTSLLVNINKALVYRRKEHFLPQILIKHFFWLNYLVCY